MDWINWLLYLASCIICYKYGRLKSDDEFVFILENIESKLDYLMANEEDEDCSAE